MKKNILIILFLSVGFTLFAQNKRILTPDGNLHSINEVMKVKRFNKFDSQTKKINPVNNINGTIDTLKYPGPWDVNFGFYGQDWLLNWYEAPADIILKKVGFACIENDDGMTTEVKVVKVNWSKDELMNADVLQRGYYEATGNGYNDITAFLDNPDRTGGWTSIQPGDTEPFGNDIWSFSGTGFQIIPIGNSNEPTYQWVDLSILKEPEILQREIFGIAIKHTGPDVDTNRIGYWSGRMGIPGWKFYANVGWWTREYSWNFVVEVELLSGSTGVFIRYMTRLDPTFLREPRTVQADIVTGLPKSMVYDGVTANLYYNVDGGEFNEVSMLNPGGTSVYVADIPAIPVGDVVEYYVMAWDTLGNQDESFHWTYRYIEPSGAPTLVVFNGFSSVTGYPQEYYWGSGNYPNDFTTLTFDHDVWAYGPLIPDLVDNYTNIIEIASNGPNDINSDIIREWIAGDPGRNYLLAGDEWLGVQSGWVNGEHLPGEFQFDILGINYEYNDVNYVASGDQLLPSVVFPQMGSLLGDPIYDLYAQVSSDSGWTAPMAYDPYYEIGVSNWIDGVDFEADVEVDLKGMGADGNTYNVAGHRTLPAGNKVAFFGYDPLSLNSDGGGPEYWWYGFSGPAPQVEVLKWFDIPVGVEQPVSNFIPDKFSLSQNYPNPFNPSTHIQYAVSSRQFVSLKVYDVLGNEIATLVNEEKPEGSYEVEWDASRFPSSVYFYQLRAGEFFQTKKMLLLK